MFGKTKVRHRSTPGAGIFRPYHRPGARAAAVLLSFCVAFTMTVSYTHLDVYKRQV